MPFTSLLPSAVNKIYQLSDNRGIKNEKEIEEKKKGAELGECTSRIRLGTASWTE